MLNVLFLQLFSLSMHLISIDSLNSSMNIKKYPHRPSSPIGKGDVVDDPSKKISLHPIALADYHALQYGHYHQPQLQVTRYPLSQLYPNEPIEPVFIPVSDQLIPLLQQFPLELFPAILMMSFWESIFGARFCSLFVLLKTVIMSREKWSAFQ